MPSSPDKALRARWALSWFKTKLRCATSCAATSLARAESRLALPAAHDLTFVTIADSRTARCAVPKTDACTPRLARHCVIRDGRTNAGRAREVERRSTPAGAELGVIDRQQGALDRLEVPDPRTYRLLLVQMSYDLTDLGNPETSAPNQIRHDEIHARWTERSSTRY